MNQRTATKLALWAAAVGVILSLYQRTGVLFDMGGRDIPWYHLVLIFFSGFNWIYCGLTVMLALKVFRPRAGRSGALAVFAGALIQVVFAVYAVLPYFLIDSYGELLGDQRYLSYLGVIWALTVLAFALFYKVNPAGPATRGTALLAGLEAMLNMVLLVSFYPLNWILLINLLAVTLVAQWFWLLFLNGAPPEK